jgi:hypothetical protein
VTDGSDPLPTTSCFASSSYACDGTSSVTGPTENGAGAARLPSEGIAVHGLVEPKRYRLKSDISAFANAETFQGLRLNTLAGAGRFFIGRRYSQCNRTAMGYSAQS